MYDLFDTFFNPWYDDSEYNKKAPKQQASQNTQNLMKTDIRELADGYELQMELPGYKKEEVQAALHKGYLTISAAKSAEETVEGKYLRRERYTGSCQIQVNGEKNEFLIKCYDLDNLLTRPCRIL